jgi:8-oxo-dGTP diphosphatase
VIGINVIIMKKFLILKFVFIDGDYKNMFENRSSDGHVFGDKLRGVHYTERIAVYGIVVNYDGKVATIKTPTGYFLPGGGSENEETHEECLKREFIEETGYEIEIGRYIGEASLYHITNTGQYKKGIGHFYNVKLKSEAVNKIEEDHELLWLEPNKCAKYLFSEHQAWAVLEALKEQDHNMILKQN